LNRTFEEIDFNFYFGFIDANGEVAKDTNGYLDLEVDLLERKFDSNQTLALERTQIGVHKCDVADTEKAIDGENEELTKVMHSFIRKGGLCLDNNKEIRILAEYDVSPISSYLEARVMRCSGPDCKTDEEIDRFLDQYIKIAVIYNDQQYHSNVYGDEVIKQVLTVKSSSFA